MTLKRRTRLSLEPLEDRLCPALNLSLQSGTLTLTGSPTGVLNVTVTDATNDVQIVDNGHNFGTFHAAVGVRLLLTTHPDIVNVNLNGNTFTGNLFIDLGQGDPSTPTHPVNVFGGTVSGSLTMQNGNGRETFSLGFPAFTPTPVNILGNVYITGRNGMGVGETLFVGPGSTLSGNLTVSQVDNVDIGEAGLALTKVLGTASIDDTNSPTPLVVHVFGRVGGSASIRGTNAGPLDFIVLDPGGVAGGGVVGSSLSVDLAGSNSASPDIFRMQPGSVVGGSLTVRGGSGGATMILAGTIGQAASFSQGDGPNTYNFNAGFLLGGSLGITAGNGGNTIALNSGTFGGNVTITLGNGANSFAVASGVNISGTQVSYTGGSGADSVTIGNASNSFALNITLNGAFGTDVDAVNLGAITSLARLTIIETSGTAAANKSWTPPAGGISWPTTFVNWP